MTTYLLIGLGVAVVLEGLAYALFPQAMKRLMSQVLAAPAEHLRLTGLIALALGVLIVWLALPSGA